MAIRRQPLRSSFVSTFRTCPRRALLGATERSTSKKSHYMAGGQAAAILTDHFHKGLEVPADPYVAAASALQVAMQTGEYAVNSEENQLIIKRLGEAFGNYRSWFAESGFSVIASEIELRHPGKGANEFAGKIDLLAEKDGKIYLLDIKTHGLCGKSVSPPKMVHMERDFQVCFYSVLVEDGCKAYLGDVPREMNNAEVERSYRSIDLKIKPDFVGFIELAWLTSYLRGSKDGKKKAGDLRGDPLFVAEFTESRKDYALEVARAVTTAIQLNQFPRYSAFSRGQYTCDSCEFKNACWNEQVHTVGAKPAWMRGNTAND